MEDTSLQAVNTGFEICKTYFDLLACLCWHIDCLPRQRKKQLFQKANLIPRYAQHAQERFHELSLRSGAQPVSPDRCLQKDLLELADSPDLEDLALLLGAIYCIDHALKLSTSLESFLKGKQCPIITDCGTSDPDACSTSYYRFAALNLQTRDHYGLLLPRVHCVWGKQHARSTDELGGDPLALVLQQYYWVAAPKYREVVNLYSNFEGIGLDTDKAEVFQIIASPLHYCAPFTAVPITGQAAFHVQYTDSLDELLTHRIRRTVNYAAEHHAQIVLFPEMVGTTACIDACQEELAGLFGYRPRLTLLPTREYEKDGTWYNTLSMLDRNGDCIFQYHKQHPFIYDKNVQSDRGTIVQRLFEPIQADEKLCVIHVPGIGRIGTMICSDVFDEDGLLWLLREMRITLLLVPAFSAGRDQMERMLTLAKTHSCDVALCNTCAAWGDVWRPPEHRPPPELKEPDFIYRYYSFGHANEAPGVTVTCSTADCQGCLFITSLPNEYRSSRWVVDQVRWRNDNHE